MTDDHPIKKVRRLNPSDLPEFNPPSIADCLFHRCREHFRVPQLNDREEATLSECGACVAEEMLMWKVRCVLALDGYADRLAYSHRLRTDLTSARTRLNLLQPGAGDFLDCVTDGDPQ